MISKTIGFRGTLFSDTPKCQGYVDIEYLRWKNMFRDDINGHNSIYNIYRNYIMYIIISYMYSMYIITIISSYIIILMTDVEDEAVAPQTLAVSMFTCGNYIL